MLKLTLLVIVEMIVGLAVAGAILAVIVPVLIEHHVIAPGDLVGSVMIGAVAVLAVAAVMFRPGGALHRVGKRGE